MHVLLYVNQKKTFVDYLKTRLGLVVLVSLVVSTATLGFIDILGATGVDAVPIYMYAVAGAVAFPLAVFFTDYRGHEISLALKIGVACAFIVTLFLTMLVEGADRLINDLTVLSPALVIYTVSVAMVSSTVMVIWLNRGDKKRNTRRSSNPGIFNRN